ncbi:hypothetical protein TNCV_2373371 [Trichonephila clavipes]|nr:hypothetical protein TNCV_2373371 [Trichonephila clavipes]
MDNEGKPMDKIDEPKLLEQCDKDPEEETPNEPMDGTLESIDKSIDLEQKVMDQVSMDTFSEVILEHCDGEDFHKMSYKLLEHYSPEYLDQLLDHGDKPLVENTKKEYTEETIEQGNETMKCNESGEDVIKLSDLERVVMECCEEISDGEVENSKVERKVERAQPEKVTLKTWWNFKWL